MSAALPSLPSKDLRVLLLDADGSLFPSEEPAFVASADVTNRFLAALGVQTRYTAEHLLASTTGRNFRSTAVDLAVSNGVPVAGELAPANGVARPDGEGYAGSATLTAEMLDHWVAEEKAVVSDHLGRVLHPDPAVLGPLNRLAERFELAAVSSSALTRLGACFRATGLADLLPAERRFSAEDSLPRPTSKPNPAVYLHALERLGRAAGESLAVEDSEPGAQSAVAAGIRATIGNLTFVAAADRDARRAAFSAARVMGVIESWEQLASALLDGASLAAVSAD